MVETNSFRVFICDQFSGVFFPLSIEITPFFVTAVESGINQNRPTDFKCPMNPLHAVTIKQTKKCIPRPNPVQSHIQDLKLLGISSKRVYNFIIDSLFKVIDLGIGIT